MTWKKSIGCLIGFAGVIVINLTPGGMAGGFQWMGEGLILVCSMAYGASSVTLKLLSGKETPTAITAFQLLFGGGMLILAGVFAWRPRAWIYDAVRVAFIVYGTAVHGCIQHMGVAFEV